MRILFVTNLLPYPPRHGGQARKYRAALALARDHRVSMLGVAPVPADLDRFRASHPEITFVEIPTPADGVIPVATAAREAAERTSFDAVHVATLRNWPGERVLAGKRVVLDAENLESQVLRRIRSVSGDRISGLDVASLEALERHALGRAGRVLVCSEDDARAVRRLASSATVSVAPNGVDLDYFPYREPPPAGERPVVCFTGMLGYWPNADACLHLARDVLPRLRTRLPGVRLRIVGAAPPAAVIALRGPSVEVMADVPDIRPYLSAADVLAVPLRAGGGTRLKILEALAAGVPVVSTALGAEGLAVEDGRHLRIADGPEALAAAIGGVLSDTEGTRAMTRRGRALVEERFGWEAMERSLSEAYAELEAAA